MEASSFKVQDTDACGGCRGGFQRVAALGQGEGRCGEGGVLNLSPGSEPQLYFLRKHVPLSPPALEQCPQLDQCNSPEPWTPPTSPGLFSLW